MQRRIAPTDAISAEGTRDPVPRGYLTLHEAVELILRRRRRKVSEKWRSPESEKDEPAFLRELTRVWRQRLATEIRFATAFKKGFLEAVARDPRTGKRLRVLSSWWSRPFFPTRPFANAPLRAPPLSPLGPYRGRTLLVSRKDFERWLSPRPSRSAGTDQTAGTAKRQSHRLQSGRPQKYPWDQCDAAMRLVLDVRGRPREGHGSVDWQSQAGLARLMASWFMQRCEESPAWSSLQDRCKKLLEECDNGERNV